MKLQEAVRDRRHARKLTVQSAANLHPGTHHVRYLTQELETTPPPKKLSKPPAPPDHIFSPLTEEFKQAFLDDKTEDIKALLNQYDLFGTACPDFLKFDRIELMKLVKTKISTCSCSYSPSSPPSIRPPNHQHENAQS